MKHDHCTRALVALLALALVGVSVAPAATAEDVTITFIQLNDLHAHLTPRLDIVPRMHSMLAFGLTFLEGEKNYRELVERHARELRGDGAQIVAVMSELGIHKDYLSFSWNRIEPMERSS